MKDRRDDDFILSERDSPDIPRDRRRCYGIRPGAPCPSYDDGTWPEGCDCMNRNDQGIDFVLPVTITMVFAIVVTCLVIWSIFGSSPAKGADNDTPCLTKEQARAKWPKDWLYWHGANRCWDNVRAYARPDRRHKSGKGLSVDANGRPADAIKIRHWNEYNELDAAADSQTFFSEEIAPPVWRFAPVPKSRFRPWDDRIGM